MTPRDLAAAEIADQLRYCYRDRASGFQGRWGRAVEQAERHIEKLEAIRDGLRSLALIEGLRQELEDTQADLAEAVMLNDQPNDALEARAWAQAPPASMRPASKGAHRRRPVAQPSLF